MFFSLSSSTDQPMVKGYPILLWLFGSFLCIHHYYRSFQFARTWLPHNFGIRSGVRLFEVGSNIYHSRWANSSSKKRSFWCFLTSLQFLCIHNVQWVWETLIDFFQQFVSSFCDVKQLTAEPDCHTNTYSATTTVLRLNWQNSREIKHFSFLIYLGRYISWFLSYFVCCVHFYQSVSTSTSLLRKGFHLESVVSVVSFVLGARRLSGRRNVGHSRRHRLVTILLPLQKNHPPSPRHGRTVRTSARTTPPSRSISFSWKLDAYWIYYFLLFSGWK